MAGFSDNQARQALQAGNPARRSALDVEDDYSQFEVRSRSEIRSILSGMCEEGSPVTFYFNQGYDFLLTLLVDIAADGRTLVFDCGSNAEMNRRVLQTDKINCVSSKEKVRIQFILLGVDPTEHEGRDARDLCALLVECSRPGEGR